MASFGRQVRPSVGRNEAMFSNTTKPYRFVRPACGLTSGYCTIKCYDHDGNLLWVGDQGYSPNKLDVDSSGNSYTSIAPGYSASASSISIIEKRDSDGVLTASLAGETTTAPELGVGRFKSSTALSVSVTSAGVYYIEAWEPDSGLASLLDNYRRPTKQNTSLSSRSYMSLTNGSDTISDDVAWTHMTSQSNYVAIARLSEIATWDTDAFSGGVATASDQIVDLEFDSTNNVCITHYTSPTGGTYRRFDVTPAAISAVSALGMASTSPSGGSMFGIHSNSGAVAGITLKDQSLGHQPGQLIAANSSGKYALSTLGTIVPPHNPTIYFYDASDNLVWSDEWGSSSTDDITDIVVTSDRVYVCGDRVFLE